MSDYLERTKQGHVFVNSDVDIVRAAFLASSLDLYAKTGMKPTRTVGPKDMLTLASQFTGRKFTGKDKYTNAAEAVRSHINFLKAHPNDNKGLPKFPTD